MAKNSPTITFKGDVHGTVNSNVGDVAGNVSMGNVHHGHDVSGHNNAVGIEISKQQETLKSIERVTKEKFGQVLGEGQISFLKEQLQKATTLNGVDPSLFTQLPALNKIGKSVCMLQVDRSKAWGTAFHCEIVGTGIVFCSAGHNFQSILNEDAPKDSLKKFSLLFGNLDGSRPLNADSPPTKGQAMNLKEFLDPFEVCGSISYDGNRVLIKNGEVVHFSERDDAIGQAEDYCTLLLKGATVKEQLTSLGIDSLVCGKDDYLKYKNGGMVAIFGHPNLPEAGSVPLRISFGAEKDPEKTKDFFSDSNPLNRIMAAFLCNYGSNKKNLANNFIFYDNDTFPGNSGSPVLGRGDKGLEQSYAVKGIHIRRFNAENTNGAQNIEKIQEWIDLGKEWIDLGSSA